MRTITVVIAVSAILTTTSCQKRHKAEAAQLAVSGSAALQKEEWQSAYDQFERAAVLRPSVPEYHTGAGMAAAKLGRFDVADRHYAAAEQILVPEARTDPERVDDLALLLALRGRHKEAAGALKDGSERFPAAKSLQILATQTNSFQGMVLQYGIDRNEPRRAR